ncbi:MAG: RagB/SusD family nutrient uptake outer membrane protein, partial [Bacteroidales bacterium]|nr:RagB/SusD family nutrient uptake outer membrane protein [Bacteroidales bacterium]
MKSIIYSLLFTVVLSVGLSSCTDMLDEKPLSTLTPENTFETKEDAEAAIYGMYRGLTQEADPSRGLWRTMYPVYGWGVMGTDIWSYLNANKFSKFTQYSYSSADDEVRWQWFDCYKVINRANLIIANAGNVNASEEYIEGVIAEAKFIRAFVYMDLVQFYGGVPLRIKPTEGIEEALEMPRSTQEQVWMQIISDLEEVQDLLPSTAIAGRATKWAAKGLLAKAYLTRGGYPVGNYENSEWFKKAAEKALEVIDGSGKTLNPTTPGSENAFREYGKQFLVSGENSPESLFEIQFLETDYGSGWGYQSLGGQRFDNTQTGYSYYYIGGGTVIGSDFALSFDDNDIRYPWSVGAYSISAAGTRVAQPLIRWRPNKFRFEKVPGAAWGTSVNAIALRMADVYLMYAEAYNEAFGGPTSGTLSMTAYEAINEVRKRAQVTELDDAYLNIDSPYSGEDLLYGMSYNSFDINDADYSGRHVYYKGSLQERFREAVLMERAWELCFERHRWFDLKRTGKLLE